MVSNMYPGQSSSVTTLRPTKLLDLPNELLSRITDFLIPRHTVCPETVHHAPRDVSIGLTCIRLFKLVRKRFLKLDFVQPRSLNDISRIPKCLSRNIELFTRLASPFAEVLRLPTDFCPKDPGFTSLGWCPHLRELCVTINKDVHQMDMEQYFIGHKKLEVLILHTPGKDVLAALAYASLKIRELTLVTLQCSEHTLQVLDNLLSTMNSLQSLTISFYPGRWKHHYPRRLQRFLTRDPEDRPYLLEPFLHNFSKILRRNFHKLTALRNVSLWSGSRAASLLLHPDDIHTTDLASEVRLFSFYVDNARELAFDNPPDLKLHKLRLRMVEHGEPVLEGFMQGLVDASTEVIIQLYNLTVHYPALVDQSNPPLPVITEIRFGDDDDDVVFVDDSSSSGETESSIDEEYTLFYGKYSMLQRSADFKLESLVIDTMDSTKMLLRKTSRKFLSSFFRGNNLKSVMFNYTIDTRAQLKMTMQLLRVVSSFADTIRELVLPRNFMFQSEVITTKDLAEFKFAKSLRVLRLFNMRGRQSSYADFKTYEDVHIRSSGTNVHRRLGEILVERLPEFLEKLRQAFPNLTHLFMEPVCAQNVFDSDMFRWVEQIIKEYEKQTGVDASSLRTELETWTGTPDMT